MRLTRYFMPTLKKVSQDIEKVSHSLMLRSGLVRQNASGIYSWLPNGLKVLSNIEKIIREEHDKEGCSEILMPTIQPADLWKTSGRYDDYGKEMLRISDRHGQELLYGPTNEEMVTDLFARETSSYRDFPKTLYHIQWKFRDEVRPRFGVMRGREFLMKDSYSFDIDEAGSKHAFYLHFLIYLRIFARLGLTAIPARADSGPIGGDLSYEFAIVSDTGESDIYYQKDQVEAALEKSYKHCNDSSLLGNLESCWKDVYCVTDEMVEKIKPTSDQCSQAKGIEIGHIFYLGTKYSKTMGANFTDQDGNNSYAHMGCYGIGVSRLVGALIEASHDDHGIIWNENVAPFKVILVNLHKDHELKTQADQLYEKIAHQLGQDQILYDDREYVSPGEKFAEADLSGTPWQIIFGRDAKEGKVEIKERSTNKKQLVEISNVNNFLANNIKAT